MRIGILGGTGPAADHDIVLRIHGDPQEANKGAAAAATALASTSGSAPPAPPTDSSVTPEGTSS